MKTEKFPKITLKGTAEEIGFQHGKFLAARIEKTIDFYWRIFNKSETDIFKAARQFKVKIREYNEEYAREIEAVAEGAKVNPLWIFALNARSELLSVNISECTALYFRNTCLLGQNWDWTSALESLAVVMEIVKSDGHKIIMITEPGIIGKIGLNSQGIGVCLNRLHLSKMLDGVPIHIVLRSVLDSKTITEARDRVKAAEYGKAANIMAADGDGTCFDVEFANNEAHTFTPTDNTLVHTNHYLRHRKNIEGDYLPFSTSQLNRAREMLEGLTDFSIDTMKQILSDRSNTQFPICREYITHPELGDAGTVCSIIMDLKNKCLHLTKGSPLENKFKFIGLNY
jgi:isopenicillin-N N-acyltransferase-like protein